MQRCLGPADPVGSARLQPDRGGPRRQLAHAELVDDLEHVEKQDMLAACVNRLERIARKAEKAGQYAAAVGATRSLLDLSMQSSHHRPPMGRFGHG